MNKLRKVTALLLVASCVVGLSSCNRDKPTPSPNKPRSEAEYTEDQFKDLANRVAQVASIRFTGYGEAEMEVLASTISGEFKDQMSNTFYEAFTDRFISLQDRIDLEYFGCYDSHYSEWADESTPTYEEWLLTEEAASVGVLDGRIVEHEGQLGIWKNDVQVQSDGSATVVICGNPVQIEIGQASSITRLLDDHGYDFQPLSWGYFNNGEILIKVGSKPYTPEGPIEVDDPEAVGGEAGGTSTYSSGTYTILLKGAVGENEDGTLNFIPTPESYVWLVKELDN